VARPLLLPTVVRSRSLEAALSLLALGLALLATACNASIGNPGGADCGYGDFVCGDGSCVPRAQVCNGTENCPDGKDEDDCATRCERNQYRCRDGVTCISQESLCDRREDCPGGDDEATCGNVTCPDGFACPDGTCLPPTAKCNGTQECPGGEDEARDTCAPAQCPNRDDLRCGDGTTCVPKARQCDGVPHCPDGDDEGAGACAGQGGDGDGGGKDGMDGGGKPNGGGNGPDKPGGGGGGRPCGEVPATGRCGQSDVLEWCDSGRLERQSCRRQGMVCGRNLDGEAACVAPTGGAGADQCGDIPAAGTCQGNTLVFCVSGQIRTQDCGRTGTVCDASGGAAACVLPSDADACVDLDVGGECKGNEMVWCDEVGARRTYDCAASGMTCGPKANGELSVGCSPAPCDGVSYFGECSGDTLRYCQSNSVLVEVDCRSEYGLGCGLQNDTIGYNCTASGTAGGSCGDITWDGVCQGDKVVWCSGDSLDVYDCSRQGMTCGASGALGNWCVPRAGAADGCGTIDFQGTCQGDVAMWCSNGQLRSKDCGDIGQGCGFINPTVGYYCSAEAAAPTCANRCNAGQIAGATPACYCDNLCIANGDCCGGGASYQNECGAAPSGPTCAGSCGSLSPAPGSSPACYCDPACTSNGDCCGDYQSLCTIDV
jgi:hypothetical protein